jgi:hypothetical protein
VHPFVDAAHVKEEIGAMLLFLADLGKK